MYRAEDYLSNTSRYNITASSRSGIGSNATPGISFRTTRQYSSCLIHGSAITWYPSLYGVQAGMKQMGIVTTTGQRTVIYWIELHRNGAVNVLWQTPIGRHDETKLPYWKNELIILKDFTDFNRLLYQKNHYCGPDRFKFSINRLSFVEFRPGEGEELLAAQLPGNSFSVELIEDTARLFEDLNTVLRSFAASLFQAYGKWEAPNQSA